MRNALAPSAVVSGVGGHGATSTQRCTWKAGDVGKAPEIDVQQASSDTIPANAHLQQVECRSSFLFFSPTKLQVFKAVFASSTSPPRPEASCCTERDIYAPGCRVSRTMAPPCVDRGEEHAPSLPLALPLALTTHEPVHMSSVGASLTGTVALM